MTEDWRYGGFGLYLHWPFCAAKCPYCDFNSHVRAEIDQSRWLDAYRSEIGRYRAILPDRVLTSVFIGGGTPSLMDPDVVAEVLEHIRTSWPTANDLEVTLEANPGSVEAGRFAGYAQAGVTRVSMGVQALNDTDLRRLGRIHTTAEAKQAFDIARKYFGRVSFDLIYARQDQTVSSWRSELAEALNMAVDHLSLYQLTIEPGTAFGDRHACGGLRGLPDEDTAAAMYEATQDLCEAAGYNAYEVSNHAKPGAESRHNLIYWRYGDYVGIGPGAHGRITHNGERCATEAWSNPERWLTMVRADQAERCVTPISKEDQAGEYLMMGLRLAEGIELDRYARLAGTPLDDAALSNLEEVGMITRTDRTVRATPAGRLILNAVIKELLLTPSGA
ncbi:radical SAM family heme chaperone HemW [Roseovarius aestuariivivens]|uniref:radical SAM family heme chaperone HemW n=1 Tax=Roseovarius aestuariivivens TaxID=1888910 RepID=UPI00107FEC45|nr:radical SAM family heme chaperone HemW [Roseovarius aestuariivivens]